MGYELPANLGEHLGDGVWYLRMRLGSVNHRIFYFFGRERNAVCLSHHCTTERTPEAKEIQKAADRKALVMKNQEKFTRSWSGW